MTTKIQMVCAALGVLLASAAARAVLQFATAHTGSITGGAGHSYVTTNGNDNNGDELNSPDGTAVGTATSPTAQTLTLNVDFLPNSLGGNLDLIIWAGNYSGGGTPTLTSVRWVDLALGGFTERTGLTETITAAAGANDYFPNRIASASDMSAFS